MTGSPGGLSGSITSGSVTPALMRAFRTRSASSPAALLVKVEAEDLLGGDLSGADQPHHARGHHRRLAGSGAGHDHLRGGRCGDAGRLLRGERDAEELLELLGVGDTGWHVREASRAH